jgi:hypothetical protein
LAKEARLADHRRRPHRNNRNLRAADQRAVPTNQRIATPSNDTFSSTVTLTASSGP